MVSVYVILVCVKPASEFALSMGFASAYVSCHAAGKDVAEAVDNVLRKLGEDGFDVVSIDESIYEMESGAWGQYVLDKWPEYVDALVSQPDFDLEISRGGVVYGPFGTF